MQCLCLLGGVLFIAFLYRQTHTPTWSVRIMMHNYQSPMIYKKEITKTIVSSTHAIRTRELNLCENTTSFIYYFLKVSFISHYTYL